MAIRISSSKVCWFRSFGTNIERKIRLKAVVFLLVLCLFSSFKISAQNKFTRYYDVEKYCLRLCKFNDDESDSMTLKCEYDTIIKIKKSRKAVCYRISLISKDSLSQEMVYSKKGLQKEKLQKAYLYNRIDSNVTKVDSIFGTQRGNIFQLVPPSGKVLSGNEGLVFFTTGLAPDNVLCKIRIDDKINFCYSNIYGIISVNDSTYSNLSIDNVNYTWFIEISN
ncbi:MAG: hypothetical protein V4613_07145 [Bacteroidota bacterium]